MCVCYIYMRVSDNFMVSSWKLLVYLSRETVKVAR